MAGRSQSSQSGKGSRGRLMMDMREKYAIFGQKKKNVIQSGIRNKEFRNSN